MPRKPKHISQEAWDAVDLPEFTGDELAKLKPAREALSPALFEKLARRGPQKTPTKEAVSLRLDRDVVDHFRAKGKGWQTEINDALRDRAKAEGGIARITMTTRAASSGVFATKGKVVKAAKSVATSALTQGSDRGPRRTSAGAAHSDKKRAK